MRLAYVTAAGRGATDACLSEVVARLAGSGLLLAGGVQHNIEREGREVCDMDLTLLPDGPALRISQDLGAHAEGCRLDGDALEGAVQIVAGRLSGADVLIVNKYGKQELTGRGFVPLIAAALEAGQPVVVGVNDANLAGFLQFAGDMAEGLPDDPARVTAWILSACPARQGA